MTNINSSTVSNVTLTVLQSDILNKSNKINLVKVILQPDELIKYHNLRQWQSYHLMFSTMVPSIKNYLSKSQ